MAEGRPPTKLHREAEHQPVSVKQVAVSLPAHAWKIVAWRAGTRKQLTSRFAAVRIRPAHLDQKRSEPYPKEWRIIEWLSGEAEPSRSGTLTSK
jgi:SRSO17 transposase